MATGLPKGWHTPSTAPSLAPHLRGLRCSQQRSVRGSVLSLMDGAIRRTNQWPPLLKMSSFHMIFSLLPNFTSWRRKPRNTGFLEPLCSVCLCLCIYRCPHVCTPPCGIFEGLDIPECRGRGMDNSCTNVPCLSCSRPTDRLTEKAVALHCG